MADFLAYPYELKSKGKEEIGNRKDGIKERRKNKKGKIKKQKRQCNFPLILWCFGPLILIPQVSRGRTNPSHGHTGL